MAAWPITSPRMAVQLATASPQDCGHTGRSVQNASISTMVQKSQSAASACSKQMHGFSTDGQRQHHAAHVSTFMVLVATACLQRPAEHVGMHTRGILGIMCVMGMCIRSRLEVLYGHEHNVERHRLYARIM